jgi:PAS domain S-box-containing protein
VDTPPSRPPAVDAALLEDDVTDLYESAPCGYLSALTDGAIVKVNQTFLTWTGYGRDELTSGARLPHLLTVGGRIFFETHFAPLLQMQGAVREIAFDLVCKDGRVMPILVNAALRRADAGVPAIVRCTVFDATDRRRYERELLVARNEAEREAKARSELIAMLSHDIRTPLNAFMMATTLLERSNPTPEQQQFIRVLKSSSANALALVNNVLDLTRLEAGRAVLREREFDMRELAREVVTSVKMLASRKPHLALNVTVDERLPSRLLGDTGKLSQVFTNLLSNAVKFTEQGFVSLIISLRTLDRDEATLEIAVSDTGIGIPADRLPHIFDEFTQGSDEIAAKYGGSGLGLAITRKLLLLYGSELRVTSTVGQGTTFSFVLTLQRPSDATRP